jgi:hypothetical protein
LESGTRRREKVEKECEKGRDVQVREGKGETSSQRRNSQGLWGQRCEGRDVYQCCRGMSGGRRGGERKEKKRRMNLSTEHDKRGLGAFDVE